MTDPSAWIAARIAGAPPSLRDAVRRELQGRNIGDARDVAAALTAAAERILGAAAAAPASPDAPSSEAMSLLTADTLVTLACEWVAEHEPDKLGELR